jgi:hypothetical protein
MFFNEDKNIALFNRQSLDTYHEIVVSFDYARYSKDNLPTGGFGVVFYSGLFERPKGGGPDYCVGYLPSPKTDYCKLDGYPGLNGAILGVGFDLNGSFAKPGQTYNGINDLTLNSVTVRLGLEENYRYVSTSKNLLTTRANLLQAKQVFSDDEIEWNSVRIIISKGFTNIQVQVKKINDRHFVTVLDSTLPAKERDAVKVAITSTTTDDSTFFDIRNFNVAGFPGIPKRDKFDRCIQTNQLGGFSQGLTLVDGDDFVAVPNNGEIWIYKLQNSRFVVDQVLSDTAPLYLLGGNEKFLFARLDEETTQVVVYYYNENRFFRSQEFDLYDDVLDLPDNRRITAPPVAADTDNKTLAIGTGSEVILYQYAGNANQGSVFGTWQYFQTIVEEVSGGLPLGHAVQVEDTKLLAGSKRGFVNFYLDNGTEFVFESTINDPVSGNYFSEFGTQISMQRNDAIIGSPNAFKLRYNSTGQGEAYHYFYSLNRQTGRRTWRKIMNIGNFFLIDSPGGNFGSSVRLKGNNLIISAPYENYLYPPDAFYEDNPNVGRVYFFRKAPNGIFTQGVVLAPEGRQVIPYSKYGMFVALFEDYIGSFVTQYTIGGTKPSEVSFFNVDCVFPKPPVHIPIENPGLGTSPFGSMDLINNAGYVIDMETLTYMQLLCAPSSVYTGRFI